MKVQAPVSNSITHMSRFGYAHLATNDTHAEEAMKRRWVVPGQGLTRRLVYHLPRHAPAGGNPQRVRTTRKRIGLSPQPKDRA